MLKDVARAARRAQVADGYIGEIHALGASVVEGRKAGRRQLRLRLCMIEGICGDLEGLAMEKKTRMQIWEGLAMGKKTRKISLQLTWSFFRKSVPLF